MKKTVYYFKATFLALCIGGMASVALGQNDPFISVWQTDNDGTSNTDEITIPATGDYTYSWAQINSSNDTLASGAGVGTGVETIDFGGNGVGTYRISITPDNTNSTPFNRIEFNNADDKSKIIDIEQWGDIEWASLENAYYGADKLSISATDTIDLSTTTSMAFAFAETSIANIASLNGWDVSTITDMQSLFYKDSVFNENIEDWDVSAVTTMNSMFTDAIAFNQNIGGWNVANVTDMENILSNTSTFNQLLDSWDLSSLTGTISLDNSGINCDNYGQTLAGWSNNANTPSNIILDADALTYGTAFTTDRDNLINNLSWTINNDAIGTCSPVVTGGDAFITVWKTDNDGTSNTDEITIPATGDYTYSWAQINSSNDTLATGTGIGSGVETIDFGGNGVGTYRISITPDNTNSTPFNRIEFNNAGDKSKIIDIEQWGNIEWASLENAYYGADKLSISADDTIDLSNTTDMNYAFASTYIIYIPGINNWDVSTITNMEGLFYEAIVFNDTITDWNVSNVVVMDSMFTGAKKFNQEIGDWNVSQVTGMHEIFTGAAKFNQSLANWDLQSLVDEISLANSGINCINYSKTLHGWLFNANLPNDILLKSTGRQYSTELILDRSILIDEFDWTIDNDNAGICNGILKKGFITLWETTNPGVSANDEIKIPAIGDYDMYWAALDVNGDSTSVVGVIKGSGAQTFNFGGNGPGMYRVMMVPSATNPIDGIQFANTDDKDKILDIEQWGGTEWGTMEEAYFGASNLEVSATDSPDLSNLTSMKYAFSETTMSSISAIDTWDVSAVTDMSYMFRDAVNFNSPITNWNVENVSDFSFMFENASSFNDTIMDWNTGSATTLEGMFMNATSYNSPVNNWNVSNVTNMNSTFNGATDFNQILVDWDVLNVTDMENILSDANSYNQTLGSWELNSLVGTLSIDNTGMDCETYSQTLFGWSSNSITTSNITLEANGQSYSTDVTTDRDHLINDLGWTINNDTQGSCSGMIASPFITIWETTNTGSSNNNQINLPAKGQYLYTWEEVGNPSNTAGGTGQDAITFTFPSPGTYKLSIFPALHNSIEAIKFNNGGDKAKLLEIQQWGDVQWKSMKTAYLGATNLEITAPDSPDLSQLTDMEYAFGFTNMATIQNIENWDVSNVVNMKFLFYNATNFNQDISAWDIGNVKNMSYMFADASSFNQPIGNWDVSNVDNMSKIFDHASSFDQSLENWKLRGLSGDISISYSGMSCKNYSRSIRSWSNDTSTVKDFTLFAEGMQYGAEAEFYRKHLMDSARWVIYGDSKGWCSLGVDEYMTQSFSVFPNPTESEVNIEGLQGNETIRLMDVTGRMLKTIQPNSYSATLNMEGLANGVYNLIIVSKDGQMVSKKVLKQ